MNSRSLTDIANESGTDKGTVGPSAVHGGHNYTDIYEAYLGSLRQKPCTILEVGIGLKRKDDPRIAHGRNSGGGGSIKMWSTYFEKGTVYAADIVDGSFLNSEKVKTFILDQGDEASLRAFKEKLQGVQFDAIIDDGSHHPDHQQKTIGILFPLLKSGGIYFIEDVQKNGYGDPVKHGQGTYSDRALNTRSVLRSFISTGSFGTPHSVLEAAELGEAIDSIHFHVPLMHLRRGALLSRLWGGREKIIEFQSDSELLIAVRKK